MSRLIIIIKKIMYYSCLQKLARSLASSRSFFQIYANWTKWLVFLILYYFKSIKYGWKGLNSLKCYEADFSENEAAVKLAGIFWYNMMLKAVEFIETVIFALRKKNNQISTLHVYHHVSTFCIGWTSCKYLPGKLLKNYIKFHIIILNFLQGECCLLLFYSTL